MTTLDYDPKFDSDPSEDKAEREYLEGVMLLGQNWGDFRKSSEQKIAAFENSTYISERFRNILKNGRLYHNNGILEMHKAAKSEPGLPVTINYPRLENIETPEPVEGVLAAIVGAVIPQGFNRPYLQALVFKGPNRELNDLVPARIDGDGKVVEEQLEPGIQSGPSILRILELFPPKRWITKEKVIVAPGSRPGRVAAWQMAVLSRRTAQR